MFSEKIRVAITDDSPIVVSGLVDILKAEEDIRITGTYGTAAATSHGLNGNYTDILLLDINLPDQSGLDLLKELKYHHPTLKIILLSSFENAAFVKQGMKNGAMGYLPKSITKHELSEALHSVAKGNEFLHPKIQTILLQDAIGNEPKNSFIPTLTRREKQILDLISEEYTTQEIGLELNISVKTVETHRAHLFQKLNVKNIAGLVRVAMEKGLL